MQFTSRAEFVSETLWHDWTRDSVMFAQSTLASSDMTGFQVQLVDGHEYLGMDQGMSSSLLKRELYTFDLSVGSTRKAIHSLDQSELALADVPSISNGAP